MPSATIAGIVLAAGASRRMGHPKALLPVGDETFVARVVRTLETAGVRPVVVVAGTEAREIETALARAGVTPDLAVNQAPERGQLSSLIVALDALEPHDVGAALVCLVDTPLVRASTVGLLIDTFRRTGAPVVRPVAGGRHGHPVIFARRLFEELRRADPAEGAKTVVRAHAAEIADVCVDDSGAFADVDTPDDYREWIEPGTRASGSGTRDSGRETRD